MKSAIPLVLAPALCVLVSACGGGGGDGGGRSLTFDSSNASQPAPLNSNDDAAKVVAGLSGAVGTISSADFDTSANTSKPSMQGSQKSSAQQVQKTTLNCSGGGTATERDDGKVEFNNCKETDEGVTTTLHGVANFRCDSGSLETECFDLTTEAGENGNALYTEVSFDGESSTILLRGTLREEDLSASIRETIDGDARINVPDIGVVATLLWDNFIVESTGSSFSVNGDYGVSINRGVSNCQSGKVNITTQTDIQIDNEDRTVAGAITLMNEGGSSASVTFNADNSVTVSVNGGTAVNYSAEEMTEFCS